MQKNLYSEERLSFTRPNAESTMNGTFQWGRKNFNNSTISQHNKTAKSPPRNLVKVDARVYTDVQSRGLASRIVKYHENGTRFNRSISMTNLSGKSNSPLSVKKLEAKPQLRYDKAVKQNVSMTHIAPPDKSLFYGNTLSGLLRSSSVIALSQSDDDLSSENRPIIHPPVTEKELQPTRSVLEELKEISRKRINNEVLQDNDDVVDTSKKYCGRFVDAAYFSGHDYRLQQMHAQTPHALPPQSTQPTTTYKRQRESAVDGYAPSHCLSRDANCFPTKSLQPELPASPEQQSKRRYCNYNNDITSSLSSSTKSSTAKRKLCEHDGYMRQEKVLRYQSEVRLPEISAALSYANKLPITPLPNTPQTVSKEIPLTIAQQVQKSASEPIPSTTTKQQEQSQTVKPKLTLFNRNYETKKDESEEQATLDANEDDNAYARISFVKPKKAASSIGGPSASNLVMERTRKSKLALMLSGLRGEIYLGNEEEQHRLKGETKEDKAKEVTEKSLPTAATSLTATTTTSIDKPDASEQTKQPEITVAVSAAISMPTTTSSNKITSPLTGIKLTPITTTAASKEQSATTTPTFNFIAPSSTATSTPSVAPAETSKPNFSFGLSAPTANSTPATSTAAAPSFSFGLSSKTATNNTAPTVVPASTTGSTTLNFNFSSTAKTDSTATTTNTSTGPLPAAFSFGSKITTNAIANTTTTSTTAVSSTITSGFSFGSNTGTNNATSNAATTAASATPAFTFGGLAAAPQTANKPATATTTAGKATAFNFGSQQHAAAFSFAPSTVTTTANTSTTNEPPKMFSFPAGPAATNTTAGGTFAFGGNTTATANITALGTTPFGGAAANPQSAISPQSFGDAKNAAATPNTFMFGAKSATQTATVAPLQPVFGGNQENKSTPAANFSFGGINSTPKPTFGASNGSNLFGVNTNNNNAQAATTTNEVAKPNNAFSFSSAAQQPKPFAFGAATTTTNATNDSTKSTNLFGAARSGSNQQSKTFSFGSQIAPQPTATNPPSASSSFNFSNPNQTSNNTTNNNNNTSNTFAFGVGGNNNATKPAITNAFGAVAPTNNKPNTSAFTFGQANQSNNNGIFNFSAAAKSTPTNNVNNQSATINQPSTASNTFVSVASSGGFVFGAASKTATPSFGAPSASNTPSGGGFVFGAQTQQNNSTVQPAAAGNLFASTGAPPTAAVTPQSSNLFGGGSANASSASNIFGGNSNAAPAFGATSPPATNVFAISSTSGSEQRPIRRATRRLAKP